MRNSGGGSRVPAELRWDLPLRERGSGGGSTQSFAGTLRAVPCSQSGGSDAKLRRRVPTPRGASRGPSALCLVHRAEGPMRNSGLGSRLPAELRGDFPLCELLRLLPNAPPRGRVGNYMFQRSQMFQLIASNLF